MNHTTKNERQWKNVTTPDKFLNFDMYAFISSPIQRFVEFLEKTLYIGENGGLSDLFHLCVKFWRIWGGGGGWGWKRDLTNFHDGIHMKIKAMQWTKSVQW